MIRLLILLLGAFRSRRLAAPEPAWAGPGGFRRTGPELRYEGAGDGFRPTEVLPPGLLRRMASRAPGRRGARRPVRAARRARRPADAGSRGGSSGARRRWWWA